MAYIFRQKLTISELVNVPQGRRLVLVLEPEEDLARLYEKILAGQGFLVRRSAQVRKAVELAGLIMPHLLLLNPHTSRSVSDIELVKKVVSAHPRLPIVTIGWEHSAEDLKQLLSAGVASHINRKLTRPDDIALVVNAVLQN